MKYITMLLVMLPTIYSFSFAKANWKEKNKVGAIGAAVMALASIIFPAIILFIV